MLKLMSGWELEVDRGPDCLLVKVRKPRRPAGALVPLGEALWSILEQHLTYRLILDLGQVKSLDDEILDQLSTLHDRVAGRGGLMRICGLTPHNCRLLQEHQLDDRLIPYHTVEEAMMGSIAPRRPR